MLFPLSNQLFVRYPGQRHLWETPLSLAAELAAPWVEWALKVSTSIPSSFIMSFNHLPKVAEDTALWGAWMVKNKGWAHLQILARLKFFNIRIQASYRAQPFIVWERREKELHRFSGSSSLGQSCQLKRNSSGIHFLNLRSIDQRSECLLETERA